MTKLFIKWHWLLAIILISSPNLLFAKSKISYFPSTTLNYSPLDASSYQYSASESTGYGESFYFNSYDDHGNVITALISITNYNPFNKGMGSFDINWIENNKVRTVHEEFDANEIHQNTKNGTQFGKYSYINVQELSSEIYYRGQDTKGNDVEIRIDIQNTENGIQSGDSYLYLNNKKEDFWGLKMIAPQAEVTASLKSKENTKTLTLRGYLDHGNATAKVPDFSDHWYRLIYLSEDWTINLHEITPEMRYGKRKPQMLYLAKNHQPIGMYADWEYQDAGFEDHEDSPHDPPTQWTLKLERKNIKVSGTVKRRNEVLAIDMLSSVNWFTRVLVKALYSNAWQHYFLVDVDLIIEYKGSQEQVKGVGIATAEYY
mgnify:CR=1 FL=1